MASKNKKLRLDELLVARAEASDLKEAGGLILAGKVFIADTCADKPGHLYAAGTKVRVKERLRFVSRGGIKLEGALKHFNINPAGWICGDIGASSGGFSDCLLQHGAQLVYAIDVAYGQLHWKLRTDPRVVVRERLNVRNLEPGHMDKPLDLAVFDTSFISLTQVIPPVLPFFRNTIRIVALIKPQFELPRNRVGDGGVVRDERSRSEAIERIHSFGEQFHLINLGVVPSPIKGPKGNQEYLIYFEGCA